MSFRWPLSLIFMGIQLAGGASADAQFSDTVVIQGSTASSRITFQCEVVDYTGQQLVARVPGGKSNQLFDASEVVSVSTEQMPEHFRGRQLLESSRFGEASSPLLTALDREPRRWVRREILALLVRSALKQNDLAAAGRIGAAGTVGETPASDWRRTAAQLRKAPGRPSRA